MLAVASMALLATPAFADWTDDFQSYAVGSLITGQGGWTGWNGDTSFLAAVATTPPALPGTKC